MVLSTARQHDQVSAFTRSPGHLPSGGGILRQLQRHSTARHTSLQRNVFSLYSTVHALVREVADEVVEGLDGGERRVDVGQHGCRQQALQVGDDTHSRRLQTHPHSGSTITQRRNPVAKRAVRRLFTAGPLAPDAHAVALQSRHRSG